MAALQRAAGAVAIGFVVAASACGVSKADGAIVFSATPSGSLVEQLFSIAPSGGALSQLTTGAKPAIDPAFSPTSATLAFARSGSGIFTVSANGSGLRRVTTGGRDSYPTWSPDGKRLAFIRPVGTKWRLYVVGAGGGPLRQLASAPPAGRPTWTNKGLLIASGGDLLQVATASGHVLKYYGANIDAIWGLNSVTLSPGVSRLTFVGARPPEPGDLECGEGPCQRFGLFMESLTTKVKKPALIVKDSGPAAFSPDGTRLALVSGGKLEIRSLAGTVEKMLWTGNAYPTDDGPPAWH
jgi:dipeptidyl aminopeptidase/acylaminoacyl peptidase